MHLCTSVFDSQIFFLILEYISYFVELLIPLFWTSVHVCSGFQSQGGYLACVLPHSQMPNLSSCCSQILLSNIKVTCLHTLVAFHSIPQIPDKFACYFPSPECNLLHSQNHSALQVCCRSPTSFRALVIQVLGR